MKYKHTIISALVLLSFSNPSIADGFSTNTGQSIAHSAQAIAHGSAAGLKLGASVVSIPLIVVGGIGKVSADAGDALLDFANSDFPIGEEHITKSPSPSEALNQTNDLD